MCALLGAAALGALGACRHALPLAAGPAEPGERATDGTPRWLGRVAPARDGDGAVWAWGMAGMAACFTGSGLAADLADTAPEGEPNVLTVTIDGGTPLLLAAPRARTRVALAAGLPPGRHCLTVRRRTEALVGEIAVTQVRPTAGTWLPPPPPRPRQLLFIGDSITAGYGNLGADAHCHFDPATEDGTRAWGSLAAEALDADVTTLAWSGKGALRNRFEVGTPTMPMLWQRRRPAPAAGIAIETVPDGWDGWEPDAAIINLGTNDFAPGEPPLASFVAAYAGLVRAVHAAFPRAAIVLAVGPMLSDHAPAPHEPPASDAISPGPRAPRGSDAASLAQRGSHAPPSPHAIASEMVTRVAAAVPEARASVLTLAPQDGSLGYGCDWHPSQATHAQMAAALAAHLAPRLTGPPLGPAASELRDGDTRPSRCPLQVCVTSCQGNLQVHGQRQIDGVIGRQLIGP